MNRIRRAVQLFLCLSLVSASVAADPWVVRDDGVGPVKIGITLAQLKQTLHQKLSEQESGSENCFYVTASGRAYLAFMIENGHLTRVDVDAAGISTVAGIQVGDSEAHAREVYGSAMKVSPHQYVDTGHYLTVRSTDGRYGVRFETDEGKITSYYAGKYDAIQYVEGCE